MRVFVLLFVTVCWVSAQVGDKTFGEEEQIEQRREWFRESRGLDLVSRPDLLRKQAVVDTQLQINAYRGPQLPAWTSLGPSPMTMLSWSMGLVAGRVSALAVHPSNEDILYLGTASGGLWKTTDGGASWTSIFDNVGTLSIGSVIIDPSDSDTIWVGTGEQGQSCTSYFGLGLFRSVDAGANFEAVNGSGGNTLDLSFVTAIHVNPTNPQVVLAGGPSFCNDGVTELGALFRSTDGGANWTQVIGDAVNDLVPEPTDSNVVYAAVGRSGFATAGIYKSTDAGANWTRLENGIAFGGTAFRSRLAMAPTNPDTLYALINQSGGTRLYRTTNGGSSWGIQNSNACEGQCSYNLCLDVHPTNADTLLVGTIRFARSTNAGVSLSALTSGWGSGQKVHQDTHVVRYSKTNGNRFWVGSDGGLWRTDDGGSSFANLNNKLTITQFYDIAVHPTDEMTVFGGAQDNSSQRTNGDTTWNVTTVTGDGFMNLVDPANPSNVFQTSYPSGGPSII